MEFRKVKALLAGTMALSLTACGAGGSAEDVIDAKETYGCNVLNVYSPGEYIGETVVSDFAKKYNVTVNYDTFESNEMMYTKLLGGSQYDVLVPSDYMIEQLMAENLLQPVNQEQLTNLSLLDPFVTGMVDAFDEGGVYSVPYFWGSVGIVYNTKTVDPALVEEQGWEIFRNTDYKGRIYFYDSQRDGFMVAFKALGYSMNTDNPEEIQAAYEWLVSMNNTMEPAYVTDEVIDGMASGSKDIALMYSGDAAYVMTENEDMAYWEPKQGTNTWVDAMVIPANSSCPGLANEFINYIISEEVQTENSEYVGYTSVDLSVAEALSGAGGAFEGISAYLPRKDYAQDEVFHYNAELKKQLSELWTKVKIN